MEASRRRKCRARHVRLFAGKQSARAGKSATEPNRKKNGPRIWYTRRGPIPISKTACESVSIIYITRGPMATPTETTATATTTMMMMMMLSYCLNKVTARWSHFSSRYIALHFNAPSRSREREKRRRALSRRGIRRGTTPGMKLPSCKSLSGRLSLSFFLRCSRK